MINPRSPPLPMPASDLSPALQRFEIAANVSAFDHRSIPVDDGKPEIFYSRLIKIIPQLRVFARIFTSNSDSADQLVADSIVQSLSSASEFLTLQNLRVLMFYTMRNHNTCTELVRGSDISNPDPHLFHPGFGSALRDVEAAMAGLPVLLRESLMLLDFHAFSAAEAGTICRTSEDVIQDRAREARRRVKESILCEGGNVDSEGLLEYAGPAYI